MQRILMKIVDWDEDTMSMIVRYSSDDNSTNIDETPAVAVQPLSLFQTPEDSPQDILMKVVSMGISVCEERAKREQAVTNPVNVEFFRDLKGQMLQYEISTLTSSPDDTTPPTFEDDFTQGDLLVESNDTLTPGQL